MNKKIFYLIVLIFFIFNFLISLFINLDIKTLFFSIINKYVNTSAEYQILTQIRIPRTLATYFVGAGLSVTGCVLQSIFLNPLCEGYTLGISSAAAVGVVLATILNLPLHRFISSFLGVIISLITVYFYILSFKKTIDISFILAGIMLNFFFSSMIYILTIFFDPYKIHYVLLWLLGSFSSLEPKYVYISGSIIIILILILLIYSSELDILILGVEKSVSLGVNEKKIKSILIPICVTICALCVALSGVISFVGIIIPNVVKKFTGLKHKNWIIWSAISGAFFVSICDNLAKRLFYPVEVPISSFTGVVGSIFFLIYLLKGNFYGNIKS